jgi:outer membrane protein assembly factor BamE (lipoprotein component of BamABCDE complex)
MTSRIKLLVLSSSFFIFSCADENETKQKLLFDQIKVGMTHDDVVRVLGKPAYIDIDSNDNKKRYYYYHSDNNNLQSTSPVVIFDSTGKVKFSTYGDGG